MFTARKLKESIGHSKTFHAVKFSGIEHSLTFDDVASDPSLSTPQEVSPQMKAESAAIIN